MTEAAIKAGESWAVAADLSPQIIKIGREQTPVVIIDDVLHDVAPLVRLAAGYVPFAEETKSGYPGCRGTLPGSYTRALMSVIEPMIRDVYGIAGDAPVQCHRQLFSMVTRPERDLKVLQRIPHFDTKRPTYFAIMHYLNPGPFGGTGFFRHRPTGYERITEERFPHFIDSAEQYFRHNGMPPARYCRESDSHFERIHAVEYRPNRLLIYPGNLLHTGLIEPERDLSSDPLTGRLTANVFVDFGGD